MSQSLAPQLGTAHGSVRWSILGVGTAGRARGHAIMADPRSALVGLHRGRYANEFPVANFHSAEDAVAVADAVAICSPSEAHPLQVEAVLQSGRHTVVEFPLAGDAETARRLFALAEQMDCVLHVAHIEVLTPAAAALRERVDPQQILKIEVDFEGPGPELPGPELALRNVARLHRVVDFAGPFARIDVIEHSPGAIKAHLRLTSGVPVDVRFRQGPGLLRRTLLSVETSEGLWLQDNQSLSLQGEPVALAGAPPLFALDHQSAMERILEGGDPYMEESRILHVLSVVDQLREGRTGHLPFEIS